VGGGARAGPADPGRPPVHPGGPEPAARGVKDARATLRAHGLLAEEPAGGAAAASGARPPAPTASAGASAGALPGRAAGPAPALEVRDLWHELRGGRAVLRAVDLRVAPGERIALMGRNGAGKSTLLRHLAGLLRPTRGRVRAAGRVALLLQHPGDYALHERVGDEAPAAALAAVGLETTPRATPRPVRRRAPEARPRGRARRGGQRAARRRLPRRADPRDGPRRQGELAARLRALSAAGSAVLVATHDAEFAAAFAERVVLLADGRPIADAPAPELLAGGWYFATETARILGGEGGALLPEDGARLLRRRLTVEVSP
jgi:energy-coupling factor transport system ATP-binding protein